MSADRHSQQSAKGQRTRGYHAAGDAAPSSIGDEPLPDATDNPEQKNTEDLDIPAMLSKQLHELRQYASYYVSAKTDSAKLSIRNTIQWMIVAGIGMIVFTTIIVTATWFLLHGIALGVSVLFGGRVWLGNIVTGFLLLAGLGLAIFITAAIHRSAARKKVVRKYEQLRNRQQEQFGRTVADSTAESVSRTK